MNVAIVDSNQTEAYEIKKIINGHNWSIDYYKDSKVFGEQNLDDYDVVISPFVYLLRSIASKSNAQLVLVGTKAFWGEVKNNGRISGIIDKDNPEKIRGHLEFLESKITISSAMKSGTKNLNSVVEKLTGGKDGLST